VDVLEEIAMVNPFELVTASKLSAIEAVKLWCDDNRLERVKGPESCFLNGHRGTGKSMLFRVLQYDCQKILCPDSEPSFLSVYFSVRDSELLTEEMDLFQSDSQRSILSESHLCILISIQLLLLIKQNPELIKEQDLNDFANLWQKSFHSAYRFTGYDVPIIDTLSREAIVDAVVDVLEAERTRIVRYVGLGMYARVSFDGPLFDFDSFLGKIADFFQERSDKTLYVLIDDGDDLPLSHTLVLNTWIARRRSSLVFKVSTMFGYKSYETRSRSAIQHPHDFFQYDIATRHLSDHTEDYIDLLKRICEKRLSLEGIDGVSAEDFFPEDTEQLQALSVLSQRLESKYKSRYQGRAVRDYVYRHLTSEYVKQLRTERSTRSFTYSGFRTLALMSSGMVRDFIICAQRMFDNMARLNPDVRTISSKIQDDVVRRHADEVLEDVLNFKQKRVRDSVQGDWRQIRNLVEGLGSLFRAKMLSDDSERRVFSFAFQDEPGEQVERLLDLAIAEGYLMRGYISRKEGTGRRILYVLTRRLAPAFTLDVSAYSGYLSLTSDKVRSLILHGPVREDEVPTQLDLFAVQTFADFSGDIVDLESQWTPISPEEAGQ
jgi:hypothetical protein